MNLLECAAEKLSLWKAGIIRLPFMAFFTLSDRVILSVRGRFPAIPPFLLVGVLIAAPRHKTCPLRLS